MAPALTRGADENGKHMERKVGSVSPVTPAPLLFTTNSFSHCHENEAQGKKRGPIITIIAAMSGKCVRHPLWRDGANSWEHSQIHHGNRSTVQAGGVFYNHPKLLWPEYILKHTHTHPFTVSSINRAALFSMRKMSNILLVDLLGIDFNATSWFNLTQMQETMSIAPAVRMFSIMLISKCTRPL